MNSFRIVAPHFVAGGTYILRGDILTVDHTAPIIHYMIEWSKFKVKSYCERMKWAYEEGL